MWLSHQCLTDTRELHSYWLWGTGQNVLQTQESCIYIGCGAQDKKKKRRLEKIHGKLPTFFRELHCTKSRQLGLKEIVTDT